ncbi:MAG TPA: anthranilate synthase component I family protein [Candidatus Lumbricidophila sp.]|nr:anthranilate synthase component I family protein [Candidatus Lumbricidophila sp.]
MARAIHTVTTAWRDPERVFCSVAAAEPVAVWLDTGRAATAGRSVIGISDAADVLVASLDSSDPVAVLTALRGRLERTSASLGDPTATSPLGWVGWLSYEFGAANLGVPFSETGTPDAAFLFLDRAIVCDHATRTIELHWLDDDADPQNTSRARWAMAMLRRVESIDADEPAGADPIAATTTAPAVPGGHGASVIWRESPEHYRELIEACQDAIVRGDAYQLCLTTQAEVAADVDPVAAYLRLRRVSPSHHGGYLRFGDVALLSASPEQFLLVDRDGTVTTKPMKGTRRRSDDPAADAALRAELLASDKERAENLMIVDLMRNDLSKVAELGSVQVTALHAVEAYPQVFQLVSSVSAKLRPGLTALDAVVETFPAGSMTGAPKISAMNLLHGFERGPRGIYSGTFGCLGLDGSADLAMVIRSIVVTPGRATIGTGGGITALSVPVDEVEETRLKARALIAVLTGDTADRAEVSR